MFKFLLIFFGFVFLFCSLFGFSVGRSVKSILFGNPQGKSQDTSQRGRQAQKNTTKASRKKVIPKDEGEYVDYEEVKD
ncbi:MAG: DUF4834 family protein [Tannerella sp.]|jgi:hypothetical protein|nr:DUF4834 family protein [Tannerella sp.]